MGARLGEREILLGALRRCAAPGHVATWTRPIMTALRIILGDQLSLDLSALDDLDPARDVVLMMEVMEENTYVQHHKQKIVLVLAAMRHFAETLRQRGLTVDYVSLDASDNTGSFTTEIERAVIRPYSDGGAHEAQNGLLLRRDIHSLFDAGYVTVTPDLRFEVSRRIKEEFDNGRHYYELHGHKIDAPLDVGRRPDAEALTWHNENRFRG